MDCIQGVYICTGCGIGDALDVTKLEKVASGEQHAKVVRTHQFLCGKQAVDQIRKDIESEGLDRIVVCACSMRVCADVFRFGTTLVERVNIREHVAWCQEPKNEDTDMLAEDYVRMGCVKSLKSEPLEPYKAPEPIDRTILVVGGGLTGMSAALWAARAGSKVLLVEKSDRLGGGATSLWKQLPMKAPWKDLEDSSLADLEAQLRGMDGVTVKLSAEIKEISGGPGLFDLKLATAAGEEKIRVGAIVLAAGHKDYDASKLGHLGYGTSKDVVTSSEFEKMALTGKLVRPSDGKPARSVVFIQCAGSRDDLHLPYCSSVCCLGSLRQAQCVRKLDPDATAAILYRDMRTPGQFEHFYAAAQDDEGIFLTKCQVNGVESSGGKLSVKADDTLLGEPLDLEADLVVLATGIVPRTLDEKVLNLAYRQGPDCPEAKYGFPDSEFICFPYETRRTGVYAAGTVRQPMDPASAIDDAIGAALKAIQCIEITSQGAAVHPRALDTSVPDFFMQRCTQCKRCTEECPFGALDEDVKGTPLPNPTRCRRCGVCRGACPERIVSFKNYSIDMVANMIKSCEVPDPDDEKPRVLALICENDAYPSLDLVGLNHLKVSPMVRFLPVRCLGSVNIVMISQALDKGFDAILLFGCKYGDDYQCHFIKGSEIASTRMKNVGEKLQQMSLESERVQLHQLALNDYHKLVKVVTDCMETIESIGPNPFKGF